MFPAAVFAMRLIGDVLESYLRANCNRQLERVTCMVGY